VGAVNGMSFLVILGIVAVATAVGNTRPGQVATGILVLALLIAPFALVVSAAVGAAVGLIFGTLDLGVFARAGMIGQDSEPTV